MKGEVGIIGLGRMGSGIARRLKRAGWRVFGYDKSEGALKRLRGEGFKVFENLKELCSSFSGKKILWIMVPAGAVDEVIKELKGYLKEGDLVIDGGNSFYKDSIRRHGELLNLGVNFLDVGVSGGVWGERRGYCLMVGGREEAFKEVEGLFKDLSYGGNGYAYLGKPGAGHFVKMVHNGIEYGMMQAIAEGFELMKESPYELDLKKVAELFNRGSVISSWLMELTYKCFEDFGNLESIKPLVYDSGEGRWIVLTSLELEVPLFVISNSLFNRFRSRQEKPFRDKLLAALRHEFGGHKVERDG